MEPDLTPQDVAMLLLSQQDLVALGAMLGLRAQIARRSALPVYGEETDAELGSA